ncbi:MAG: double zinc ribbon domain-containing protein, partial [Deltaproteobacteria bacterium]
MFAELLNIFFPPVCPLCEGGVTDGLFCRACDERLSSQKILGPACGVCGAPFVSAASPDHTCGRCLTLKTPFVGSRSALAYNGAVVEAIHSFKYGGKVILGRPLGLLLAESINLPITPGLVMPVPLHKKRLRMRGFNQSLLL